MVNIDSFKGQRAFNNGAAEQTFQVRPGTYFLSSFVRTRTRRTCPGHGRLHRLLRSTEITITGNTTVDFDATKAHLLSVKTDRPSEAKATVLSFSRTWDDTWIHAGSLSAGLTSTAVYADVQGSWRGHLGVR